jgi:hypothetical protein
VRSGQASFSGMIKVSQLSHHIGFILPLELL